MRQSVRNARQGSRISLLERLPSPVRKKRTATASKASTTPPPIISFKPTMIYVDETDPDEEPEPPFEPRQIKLKKNQDVNTEYTLRDELGRGKFGTVYRCEEKKTGRILAAKFILTQRAEDRADVEREVEIMRSLQHPRLLQLYDAFDDSKKQMILILELIEGGELFERVIDDDFVLTEKACAIFVRQICEGVDYMHSKNILHLDMKPENVLCTTRTGNRIKLIDFGLARFYEPGKKLQVLFGTPEFVAPEVVNFDKVGFQTDMWSVGVICYVLLSGLSPFMGNSELETMANVTRAEYDFDDESFDQISEEAKDFIAKLLLKDKEDRMTAAQGLNHPWLRKDKKRDDTQLDKKKLKRFVIRRRWQKMVNAFLALRRMGATISPSTP
ncbi:LOW QUALITY PROTEIN: myosin light chain kinase, smooth muscle-like [Rhipicephalus sanguineus]|nr:LOW QUALITY PROTEIN: myosin light chain kinase, smooth muscle-like [Rhipicephalus sanguineus]